MIDEQVLTSEADWQQLNSAFAIAVELDEAARDEYLSAIEDKVLCDALRAMLAASGHAQAKGFLANDVFRLGTEVLAGSEERTAGTQIGNYRIIREIARGGMGTVFLAEREDFHQRVALKVIKRGMDTDAVLKRFVRERQILAELDHPNIARLFDGGTTEDGLPYFVMEYVDGVSITQYCDDRKLAIDARLALFRKVCAAVAYAHQNLIVHRDIKPSNILVTADGEAKLLDFGISKLLTPEASDATETAADIRMMTPEYASPEQMRGEKITTVSDIYSLGVLLYEILSGHRPFKLKDRPSAEILKIVCEEQPTAPSTAALTAQEVFKGDTMQIISPETIAEWRAETPPEHLRRRLSGDLDNIVLMSLRKEPERRYSSVDQFSEDLRRHLEHLPVLARPSTATYAAAKFFRRNRIAVSFAGVALLAILTGFSISIWQTLEARRERARAEQRFNDVRKLSNTLMIEFDEEIGNLPGSFPTRVKLANISAEYLNGLAQGTEDPGLLNELATAHFRLSGIYSTSLDSQDEARKHFAKATEIAHRLNALVPGDLQAKALLAKTMVTDGRDRSEWEQIARERVRLREEIVAAGPPDIQTALNELADAYWNVADTLKEFERTDESLVYYRRAIEIYERQLSLLDRPELNPDEYDAKFYANVWIGMVRGSRLADWNAGSEATKKALEIAEAAAVRFPDHLRTQRNLHMAHNRMAIAFENTGDLRGALEQYNAAMESQKETGIRFNYYSQTTDVKYRLKIVEILQKLGQTEQALGKLHEALDVRRKVTEIDQANPRSKNEHAEVFYRAGTIFAAAGNRLEALTAYREAESYWTAALDTEGLRLAQEKIRLVGKN
jgi:serine/threonine protein kinase